MLISNIKTLEKLLNPAEVCNSGSFKPIKSFSIDSRNINKGEAFIAVKGKHCDGHNFIQEAVSKGASAIIAEEGADAGHKIPFFAVGNSYEALKAIAAYIRREKNPVVCGITGSIGKTTTKEMLSFLLEPHFKVLKNQKTENNFLGVTKTILSLKDEGMAIFELGTNSKGEIELLSRICKPDVGVITFVKPAHLEGLGSLEGVLEEKVSLFKCNKRMKAVLNNDDALLAKVRGPSKTYWFGKGAGSDISSRLVKREGTISTFLIQDKYKLRLPTYMESFIANYSAAMLAARVLGVNLEESARRLSGFCGFAPMRMQMEEVGNFLVLNDAYNANPYSFEQVLKNLKSYPFKKIAVVGDMLELGEKSEYYHKQLASYIVKAGFEFCLTYGRHSRHLTRRLKELGSGGAFHFDSHAEIADFIDRKAGGKKGDKRYLIFLKGSRSMELEKVIDCLNGKG